MNKFEFLSKLSENLSVLPPEDIEKSLDYYSEMIDDRIDEGMTEAEAVAELGAAETLAAQILSDAPPSEQIMKSRKKKRFSVWIPVLLVLGAPVWLPLLAAALVVLLAIYVSIWSVVVSLYAADLALAVTAAACVIAAVPYAVCGRVAAGAFLLGGGLVLAGLTVLLFFGCNLAAKGVLWLGGVFLRGIRRCFVRKESAK